MAADWNPRANEIFLRASEIDSDGQRRAFVDAECRGDDSLRAAVESLLAARDKLGGFLEADATSPRDGSPETSAYRPILEGPGTVIGLYKLLQKIGEGGFGAVYMAEQERPIRRMVAIKIIKPGMDSNEVIARFESERQALALMDHPHIAKVLDAGATETGRPYFVMELVKGIPITEFCDENRMPAAQRLRLFSDVCHAVQHAHHKGIIHRDIKPSNVLVTLHDGVPVVKVIDFGIAKATLQKLTERTLFTAYGAMIGTPAYMSPEQAELSGLDIDTRSDIYSLGVLLYELLTGTTPLEIQRLREAGFLEMQRLIREQEPPRPSNRLSSLGEVATAIAGDRGMDARHLCQLLAGDLDWIVMKCLEKDRSRRYATPDALAEDIGRYFSHESILARPPSAGYRFRKFAKRNRGLLLTSATIAAALLIGTSIAVWQAILARRAAAAERTAKETAQAREAETAAVLNFVENRVFSAARPKGREGGLGYDVKLSEALRAALPFVESEFRDQRLIEARLRMTLGQSFEYLGDARTAAEQFVRSWDLRSHFLGTDQPETLECMHSLVDSYNKIGRSPEALKLCEEVLTRRRLILGADHPDTLWSMHSLANIYQNSGRLTEAISLHEQILSFRSGKLGQGHRDTLRSMYALASVLADAGRLLEALKLLEETITMEKTTLGPDHPDTLQCMYALASVYQDTGQLAEALKLREEAVALQKAKLGPDHPETLGNMTNLSISYASAGRYREALKIREEVLPLQKVKLGANHRDTLISMNNLAWILSTIPVEELRDPSRSVELARESVNSASPELRPYLLGTLGTARYRSGDWKGAIDDLETVIGSRKPEDPTNANEAFFLAMARWQLGERDSAREWYGKAVGWMEKGSKDDPELKRFRAEAEALMQIKAAG